MHHKSSELAFRDAVCACTALRKASRAVTRMYDEAMRGTGMTIIQFSILRNLARHGELPLMQLADLLVMERTTLYRALMPLHRKNWVALVDGDGRAKTAMLTPLGRRALQAATAAWESAQLQLLDAFGNQDWLTLEGSLSRLVGAAQAHPA